MSQRTHYLTVISALYLAIHRDLRDKHYFTFAVEMWW